MTEEAPTRKCFTRIDFADCASREECAKMKEEGNERWWYTTCVEFEDEKGKAFVSFGEDWTTRPGGHLGIVITQRGNVEDSFEDFNLWTLFGENATVEPPDTVSRGIRALKIVLGDNFIQRARELHAKFPYRECPCSPVAMDPAAWRGCRLVGVAGLIDAGKTTVQKILTKHKNFQARTFASALKDACAAVHTRWSRSMLEGDTEDSRAWRQKVDPYYAKHFGDPAYTPRKALQLMGLECMRKGIHDNIWVTAAMGEVDETENKNVRFVLADVRFPNEVAAIRERGGLIIEVVRGNDSKINAKKQMSDGTLHATEHLTLNPSFQPDWRIFNTNSVEDLASSVLRLANEIWP